MSLSLDEASQLSRELVDLYASVQQRDETFGEWILSTFFPQVHVDSLASGRDFFYAVRTEDARLYLLGMLRRGSLSPEPLRRALRITQE